MHPLIVSRMSVRSHFLLLVCFSFLISCQFAGNKKEIGYGEEVQLNVKEVVVPSSDVLNLKSYYLSFVYQSDSLQMLYGWRSQYSSVSFAFSKDSTYHNYQYLNLQFVWI